MPGHGGPPAASAPSVMRTLAILPIKSFGAAKQRLGATLSPGTRRALAQAMFGDVLTALRKTPGIDDIVVVTGDASAEATARSDRVLVLRDETEAGQSAAAEIGIRHALDAGYERALLVPGDTPLLDPSEVADLLMRANHGPPRVTIVPDRHRTGTNALVLSPPDAIPPSFGPGSRGRHVAAARVAGLEHRVEEVPSLSHDVDTEDDLATLAALIEERRGRATLTRGALRQSDRSGARPARSRADYARDRGIELESVGAPVPPGPGA